MSTGQAAVWKIVVQLTVLLFVVVGATIFAHEVREALDLQLQPSNELMVHRAIMVGAVVYVLLLAFPFVPGAEIGLALLATFGAAIAPLIYVCTVTSMMLAYTVGRFVPLETLERLLRVLKLRKASVMVARAAALPPEDRLSLLLEGNSKRALGFALRYRYLALALSINTPGNSVIGGGGGIMMMAGISGVFSPLATTIVVLLAVSPVPIAVYFFGLTI